MLWHPSEIDLALAGAGDLPGWKRGLIARHLRRCAPCAEEARELAAVAGELAALRDDGVPEAPWLAARIAAAAPAVQIARPRLAPAFAPALGIVALTAIAALLLRPPVFETPRVEVQAAATAEAVSGEVSGPRGRQRVVLYTGQRRGLGVAEVSAGASVAGVSQADPATGAVTITRISVGELD